MTNDDSTVSFGHQSDRVYIFDTTLRDGEQSPGATMTLQEKVRLARHLELLGVDIIEAGFPAASPGDFEAVRAVSETVRTCQVAGLCRCVAAEISTGRGKLLQTPQTREFMCSLQPAPSHGAQAPQNPRTGSGDGDCRRPAHDLPDEECGVLRRGRGPQ